MTWCAVGKQNIQAKEVYFFLRNSNILSQLGKKKRNWPSLKICSSNLAPRFRQACSVSTQPGIMKRPQADKRF